MLHNLVIVKQHIYPDGLCPNDGPEPKAGLPKPPNVD